MPLNNTIAEFEYELTIMRDVHEHEVLLAFRNDEGAYQFLNWMTQHGEKAFADWLLSEEAEANAAF